MTTPARLFTVTLAVCVTDRSVATFACLTDAGSGGAANPTSPLLPSRILGAQAVCALHSAAA
jgi:hypothetical protein